ncbi:uncharacterized protein A4U43_C04F21720 [Asparagus officinalis]|uniref:Uncharacterized protein n=1 Tax=Asparagus officinalis TaxID=4686 RepID=A0A5P1F2T3_ASPOF|nr:uncharacterized protein A4U43_C04F21720 [Asparagus officinalis]
MASANRRREDRDVSKCLTREIKKKGLHNSFNDNRGRRHEQFRGTTPLPIARLPPQQLTGPAATPPPRRRRREVRLRPEFLFSAAVEKDTCSTNGESTKRRGKLKQARDPQAARREVLPLDTRRNEKGLLRPFEDRAGNLRFLGTRTEQQPELRDDQRAEAASSRRSARCGRHECPSAELEDRSAVIA